MSFNTYPLTPRWTPDVDRSLLVFILTIGVSSTLHKDRRKHIQHRGMCQKWTNHFFLYRRRSVDRPRWSFTGSENDWHSKQQQPVLGFWRFDNFRKNMICLKSECVGRNRSHTFILSLPTTSTIIMSIVWQEAFSCSVFNFVTEVQPVHVQHTHSLWTELY